MQIAGYCGARKGLRPRNCFNGLEECAMRRVERQVAIRDLMSGSGVRFRHQRRSGVAVDMTSTVCFSHSAGFSPVDPNFLGKRCAGHRLRPSSPDIAAVRGAIRHHAGLSVDYCGAIPRLRWPVTRKPKVFRPSWSPAATFRLIVTESNSSGASGEITKADEECIET